MLKKRIYEDNKDGFHSYHVSQGVDRPVTGGNDAPPPASLDDVKKSWHKAKNILTGKNNDSNMGSGDTTTINNTTYNYYEGDKVAQAAGPADGVSWFDQNWQTAAITAGGLVALVALVKVLKKSIKMRYNKVVTTLQRAQKDFTTSPNGLDMGKVMPGIGSGLMDKFTNWFARIWSGGSSKNQKNFGNIGLKPFCNQYKYEIDRDYENAVKTFNLIPEAIRQRKSETTPENSSYNGKVYSSFKEAFRNDLLNEGVSEDKLNESLIGMVSAGIGLANLAVRAGSFIWQSFNKDGQPEGEAKQIQVTKESTREICYAIINNFANKYVNMQSVFEKIGVKSESLADLDKSSCDKLKMILKMYQKPEKNAYTRQYARVQKAYNSMLNHYMNIGNGIISNFVKYSEGKDEKHENLIVASKEKLENMWESQKDFYEDNFSHIIIEIVGSTGYTNYLNFITDSVLPIFKSGLATDADYVLDVAPKKGEKYILRQTGNYQATLGDFEKNKGNVALAIVEGFDRTSQKIKFKLLGLLNGNQDFFMNEYGVAQIKSAKIDTEAYKGNDKFELEYGKWLALDPVLCDGFEEQNNEVFKRTSKKKKRDQYVYVISNQTDVALNNNRVVIVTAKINTYDIINVEVVVVNGSVSDEKLKEIAESKSKDAELNMDFKPDPKSTIKNRVDLKKAKEVNVESDDDLKKKANEAFDADNEENENKTSDEITAENISELVDALDVIKDNNGLKFKIKNPKAIPDNDGNVKYSNGKGLNIVVYGKTNENGNDVVARFENGCSVNIKYQSNGAMFIAYSPNGDKPKSLLIEKPEDFTAEYINSNIKESNDNGNVNKKQYKFFEEVENEKDIQLKSDTKNLLKQEIVCKNVKGKPLTFTFRDGKIGQKHISPDKYTSVDVVIAESGEKIDFHFHSDDIDLEIIGQGDKEQCTLAIDKNKPMPLHLETKDDVAKYIFGETIKEVDVVEQQTNKQTPDNKSNADSEQQSKNPTDDASANINNNATPNNDSVNISYRYDTDINESLNTSVVTVTRKFSKKPRNWYVLSEAIYDDGSNKKSKLDDKSFLKTLNERSDCASFAKSSKSAKFMQLDNKQTYHMTFANTYSPSISTPLYESVVLVKFGKMDNVSQIVPLGKHKIGI